MESQIRPAARIVWTMPAVCTEQPHVSCATARASALFARGPISCSLYDEIKDFECYDGTYTIDAPPTDADKTHAVSIVG